MAIAAIGLALFVVSILVAESRQTLRIASIFCAVTGFFLLITRNFGNNSDDNTPMKNEEPPEEDLEDFEVGGFEEEEK